MERHNFAFFKSANDLRDVKENIYVSQKLRVEGTEMAWTYIKTNFRCEKKYWDNFSIFLGKITNWWEHNFSKVINTSSIQLMVLYLIKIVSNHRWAKIKEKFNLFFFFGKKTRETDSHLCTALVKLSVCYLLHFFIDS